MANPIPLAVWSKDPSALLDYTIDFGEWLPVGDKLTAAVWTVSSGITDAAEALTQTKATVWLSGGTAGTSYTISVHVTTSGNRQDTRSFTVQVVSR